MENFCRNCGSKIQNYAKFCQNCGNTIISTSNVADNIKNAEEVDKEVEIDKEVNIEVKKEEIDNTIEIKQIENNKKNEEINNIEDTVNTSYEQQAKSIQQAHDIENKKNTTIDKLIKNSDITVNITSSQNSGFSGITSKVEEIELGRFSPIPAMAEGMVGTDSIMNIANILNPVSTLLRGIKTLCVGFKNVFKNKKSLVMALVLAGVWIVLTVLPMFGINSKLMRVASWITFARGGLRGGYAGIVGGIIGKGMFATLVCSIFTGNMKGTGNGLKKIASSIKGGCVGTLLIGIGFALVLFNFMAGVSNPINSMVGITGFLLSLRALSSNSFIRRFAISCTSKKSNGKRLENTKSCQSLIAGLTVGFALASAISFIKIDYLPYVMGAVGVVAGIIVSIITSNKRKVAS